MDEVMFIVYLAEIQLCTDLGVLDEMDHQLANSHGYKPSWYNSRYPSLTDSEWSALHTAVILRKKELTPRTWQSHETIGMAVANMGSIKRMERKTS
jgi:hypothetical protein